MKYYSYLSEKLNKDAEQKKTGITIVQYFPYSIHLSEAKFVDSAQL